MAAVAPQARPELPLAAGFALPLAAGLAQALQACGGVAPGVGLVQLAAAQPLPAKAWHAAKQKLLPPISDVSKAASPHLVT